MAMPIEPEIRLVTPEEAARMLGIGKVKLYELMRSGELPAVKLPPGTNNAGRRIEMSAIRDFIERNRIETEAAR